MFNSTEANATLIQELGLQNLPVASQNALVAEFGGHLMRHLLNVILEKLPPDTQTEFMALVSAEKGDEAESFAATHIPEFSTFIADETKKLIREFKEIEPQ